MPGRALLPAGVASVGFSPAGSRLLPPRAAPVVGEPRDRRARVAARPLDVRDHTAVLLLDALQERRLVEQVGEVVRAQHDAQQVRVGRLVELDETRREDGLALAQMGLEPLDPGSLTAEVAAQRTELR